jgi:hypothetical protein
MWIAECTDGIEMSLRVEEVPAWFVAHVIDRFEKV